MEFLRMETSDKFGDKLSHICELIKNEPWAAQAIILYEVADLLDKGIEYLKIPESVWGCTGKGTLYKQVVASLLESQIPLSIADKMLGQRLSAESKFAFVCGLWNGTVEIVQSVPQMVKLLTCVFHADCRESASSQWESFKNAVIEDESGHILCHQDEYFCKVKQMISIALSDLVADNCKVAHTVGSVVGPIVATCVGDVAAGSAVIARLGKVGSGLKYAIKGLQLCDKITDITRPLAKGLKVSAVLVKKVGKLLPEIRIEGNTVLHYVRDKLHIRRFDAVTKQAIDEPVDESNLSQKIKEAFERGKDATNAGKYSLANISKERGFVDMLPELLKKEGITEEEFVNYTNYVRKELPYTPRAQIARLRNAVPSPTAETVMQKVIPASDLEMYISGQYNKIKGFITKTVDTKHFNSFDDLYYGLRLDYDGTKFFLDEGSCYAIRFTSKEVPLNVDIPRGRKFEIPYPFTSHGFTAGTNRRIGIPEFCTTSPIKIEVGSEIWKISRDGKQTLYAIMGKNGFEIVEK